MIVQNETLFDAGLEGFFPCGTIRMINKAVIKGWDYSVTLGKLPKMICVNRKN